MIQIRENRQKQLISRTADARLLHACLPLGTVRMFGSVINVPWKKEVAP